MMMAGALLDIPAIRRMDKLENVHSRRYSAGKVIMPSGGLTGLSRYLRASQGSCHDKCKNVTKNSPGTDSKISRIPMKRMVVPKRGAYRNFERVAGSNLVDRRKKTGISVKVYPNFKIQEPDDHVVIKTTETKGHNEEYAETKSPKGEKSRQVCAKPSPGFESRKPVNLDCVGDGVSTWSDKESVSSKQVLLSLKETDSVVAKAKGSKLKPQSKPSTVVRQKCPSGKHNSEGPKRKEAKTMSKTSLGVAGGRNKGETTIIKGTRSSVNTNKKNVVLPSVSTSGKESGTRVSSMNAEKKNLRAVHHLKKHENEKQIKLEKSHGTNAKRSMKIPKKTAEYDQNKVVSMRSSSSSKDKSMKHSQNQVPISRPSHAYEKKRMIYRPKEIQTNGLSPSLSSFLLRESSGLTPNGFKINQPSLTSLPSSASLESFHKDTLTENDKQLAETEKGSLKMMNEAKNKRASKIVSNDKHLAGRKLNFQRPKVIDVPVEDSTPRRLAFKKSKSFGNKNDDNRKGKGEDFAPRRLKSMQTVNGDNKNSRVEEFMPKRLKFRQGVIYDNRDGKVEEFTPRRLKFRRRLSVDNRNDDKQNNRIKEPTPRTPETRKKLIVDNINAERQNGRVDEFTLSQSELDNRNADDQNNRCEDSTPRKLIFRPKEVDETKTGYVRSPKAVTSKNKSRGKKAKVNCDNDTEVQSEKVSLRHRGVNEKKGSEILYNNIIEQTASRLAEAKTSRVKALVSAFETVISHLDTGISENKGVETE